MGNVSPCKVWSLGAPWAKLCWWQLSAHLKTTLPGCLIDHPGAIPTTSCPTWGLACHSPSWQVELDPCRDETQGMWDVTTACCFPNALLTVKAVCIFASLAWVLGLLLWAWAVPHEGPACWLKTESLFPWWVLLEHRSLECLHKSHSLQQEMSLSQVSVCQHRHLSISQEDPGSLGGLSKYLEFGIKVRKWDFLAL